MFSVNNFLVHISLAISIASTNAAIVRPLRQVTDYGCVLPQHPAFGQWSIYKSSQLTPGKQVPSGTVLQVTCQDNYKLDGGTINVCINGRWTSDIGPCLRTCPSIYSTSVMSVTCTYNDKKIENCTNAIDGTVAKFKCAKFYEDAGLDRHPVHICFNGKWSHSIPECVPVCGQKSIKNDPTLIVNGSTVIKGDYPWQVAIYNTSNQFLLCGGSLINQRVILTAAHCITNEKGKLLPKEYYTAAVGKYYRKYDDHRDFHEAQFSSIYKMFTPRQYRGEIQNYLGDIAILITMETFKLSARVQPVCVDWGFKYENALLDATRKTHGYISGWGYTVEYKQPSEVLKELEVPFISYEQCLRELPEDYEKFMTDDKVCAGHLNSSTSVCSGDSGGGLVFKFGKRYYVAAVLSLSPQAPTKDGGCNSQQYALYTKVSHYIENFVLEKEARYRSISSLGNDICDQNSNCKSITRTTTEPGISAHYSGPIIPNGNCFLPEHPTFGKWSISGANSQYTPGMTVTSESILQIQCFQGYKLYGGPVIVCKNGTWSSQIGQCLKTCPSLFSTTTTAITCTFKNQEISGCIDPAHGTIAKHTCAPFYEDLALVKNPVRVCRNGTWDSKKPECVPVCGLKSVTAHPLIVNGENAKRGDYPWHVGIYSKSKQQLLCSGALISQRLILTAAHCVTDANSEIHPKEQFTVAVGKFYRKLDDKRDTHAQFSSLENLFIPLQYTGVKNNLLGDIAILVAQTTFTLSRNVQPVCVDWGFNYEDELNNVKNITGWVSGWGYTIPSANPSNELKELKVPLISQDECIQALPENFRSYVTRDKLCAGYLNNGRSVCSGDLGGALVVKFDGRYFITGIVSSSPASSTGCDTNQYALYTKVTSYNSFILEKEAQFKNFANLDCVDDEDCEKPSIKTPSKSGSSKNRCILPDHPAFGTWIINFNSLTKTSPGTSVETGTVLEVSCENNYKLDGDTVILCENGKWSSEVGKCLRTCPSVYSTKIMKVTCFLKGKETENCVNPVDGTLAKYECSQFYEDPQVAKNPIHTCRNGLWNQRNPSCVPVCGQKSITAQTLIVHGNSVHKGDYPWVVAVYYGAVNRFICSGSLINQRLIVTSALCVTNYTGHPRPKNEYVVAAGKYYREYDDSREFNKVQFSTLRDIFIPEEYSESGGTYSYVGAIALLVTSSPFTFSQNVQPVCVDWTSQYENEILNPLGNSTGCVTGWGYTAENSDPADELQELEIPVVGGQKCHQELPENFKRFLTFDKFCAGYLNNGTSVCRGDSGGGFVIKFNGKYYIKGVLTIAPSTQKGGCDVHQYALFTKISTYINNFILQKERQFRT